MKNFYSFLWISVSLSAFNQSHAENKVQPPTLNSTKIESNHTLSSTFQPFTGKITKNKVRMRLSPALDSPVVKQLDKDDYLIVINEDDEFYAVKPPEDVRAFVFRTYVLDGVVEGNNVNVRLEPLLDAPVIAKLKAGDTISGHISPLNNKWLEITPPLSTKFYVCKDYVEKVGDSSYLTKHLQRKNTVNQLLESANQEIQRSQTLAFQEIPFSSISSKLEKIIKNYSDFETQTSQAKDLLTSFKEDYSKRKIAYLETTNKHFKDVESLEHESMRLSKTIFSKQQKIKELESQILTQEAPNIDFEAVSIWTPKEDIAYEKWAFDNPGGSKDDFYIDEARKATTLKGRLEKYKNLKNRPGDYILVNSSNTPIAFLYSTRLNLENLLGQEITITGVPRSNNNFAYPAFFVLTVQQAKTLSQ